MDSDWQRAHSPEQKEQRRAAILEAAAALFDERPIADISIGEVAKRAGVAKGSIYRYFATKEEVFLGLLQSDLDAWFEALVAALAGLSGKGSAAEVAALVVRTLRRRQVMIRLLSSLFFDIEKNLSLEAATAFKRWLLEEVGAAGAALEAALPGLSEGGGGRMLLRLNALVAGLWPMAHPAGNMKEVLAARGMAPLRVNFLEELEDAFAALLAGAVARGPGRR